MGAQMSYYQRHVAFCCSELAAPDARVRGEIVESLRL